MRTITYFTIQNLHAAPPNTELDTEPIFITNYVDLSFTKFT